MTPGLGASGPMLPARLRRVAVICIAITLLASSAFPSPAQDLAELPELDPSLGEAPAEPVDTLYLTWTTGFDYSRGDYGLDEDTSLYYVPLSLILDYGNLRFRIGVPLLVVDGPTRIVPGAGAVADETRSGVEGGLGEIQLGGSYLIAPLAPLLPYIELGLGMTIPTATSDALGTDEWGFALQADLFRRFGPVTGFAGGGRRFYTGNSLDDRFFASVGASLELSDWASMGLAYDWLEATNGNLDDAHEIAPFVSFRVADRWGVGPYAVFGLSDGSPDYGGGLTVSFEQ